MYIRLRVTRITRYLSYFIIFGDAVSNKGILPGRSLVRPSRVSKSGRYGEDRNSLRELKPSLNSLVTIMTCLKLYFIVF